MTTSVQPQTFRVTRAEEEPDSSTQFDITAISETVTTILEPREEPPSAALRRLWFSWLVGHFKVLVPAVTEYPRRPPGTDEHAQLVTDTVEFVHSTLKRGLPEEAEAAYVLLQELARTCRFLLGLASDLRGGGR